MKTPQQAYPALARELGVSEVYLKREDLHHYGSHKGRSIPYMVDQYYRKQGIKSFVISSSGNAALAAVRAAVSHNTNKPADPITLTVFIGPKITAEKLKLLAKEAADPRIKIVQAKNPKQQAFQMDKAGEAKNLRQSTDDLALAGYAELARELDKIPGLAAVFIPTSSGTTAQALGEAFANLTQKPQIHIVQTAACHPIAALLGAAADATTSATSLAGAIVDRVAFRQDKVADAVRRSQGAAWIVKDIEIHLAIDLVKSTADIAISPNSALSVAGLAQAAKNGAVFAGAVVCLITGR
ncbi:MAG: Threonine synthase [Candidatus Magasanikbacteria bacterium GW2011_GWA2_56_11]|uniref:Threonine synthase n=1 Tax=Candidatus Magasanikbacteria bacterium GW2011_GWA2_56_11 TaxID=1619044 RepID=A0A0G2AKE8_9BACT|nr:MAG: Threonine synthase [Candidatus Magasanikbacteria bacterium GW2011_GWA2_56_11]